MEMLKNEEINVEFLKNLQAGDYQEACLSEKKERKKIIDDDKQTNKLP